MTRQQSIPGTDVDHPEIRDAIERWLEACERAKAAAEKKAELDDAIVLKMIEMKVSYHPYIDPDSGKRKYRVVDTTPRGKSIAARPAQPDDLEADEPMESEDSPVERLHSLADSMPGTTVTISAGGRTATLGRKSKANAKAAKVESKKVSRAMAERDIAEEQEARDKRTSGQANDVGEFRAARDWDAEETEH